MKAIARSRLFSIYDILLFIFNVGLRYRYILFLICSAVGVV